MKKIMTILAAAAVALMLVGCADLAGKGSATGLKTNKTVNVDGTANAQKPLTKDYRRYIKQLGDSKEVAEITTTITFKEDECIFGTADNHVVIGYIFDLNITEGTSDSNTSKKRDFYLFGFDPIGKKAYVEHYTGVDFKDELDTDNGAVGSQDHAMFGSGDWASVTEGTHYTVQKVNNKDVYTLEVTVRQETKGTYTFELGGYQIGSGSSSAKTKVHNSAGYAIGGVAAYVNCPSGTKVKANYKTQQSSVTGKFFVDEEEYVEEF